jgi:hypothetical protein
MLHFELAAAFDDAIEDRLQEMRVNEMTFGSDDGVGLGHLNIGLSTNR